MSIFRPSSALPVSNPSRLLAGRHSSPPLAALTAACSSGSTTAVVRHRATAAAALRAAGSACRVRRRCAAGGTAADTLRLGYFPNVTHATAVLGVAERHLPGGAGRHQARDHHLQRRPGRDRGAALRRHRRHLHRPQPGHQRLRQVQRRRASGSSPAPPTTARRSSSSRRSTSRPTSRARRWPPRSWAAPRTWRCASGCWTTA